MSGTSEPTPDDIQAFHELEDFKQLSPHQRDAYARVRAQDERREQWAEENREWIGDHMELWDADPE